MIYPANKPDLQYKISGLLFHMPELPEVETMRRGLKPVTGAVIRRAARTPCPRKPISIKPRIDFLDRRVAGKKIVSVDRIGKRIVIHLDAGDCLIFEPRMTGIVLTGDPPDQVYLRFELTLANSPVSHLRFWDRRGLGKIELLNGDQFEERLNNGTIGPDASRVSSAEMRDRARFSRRAIKVALLDQKLIAGIGNLYASEILHVAGVDPRSRCDRLTIRRWEQIHAAMQSVLEMAIKYEGSTLSDGTYQKALNDPGGYQNHHRVYDREDRNCPTCRKGQIRRIVQAQRSTFFCPHCQKRR